MMPFRAVARCKPLQTAWNRLRSRGTDAGSGGGMSLFLVISAFALIVVTGLIYDGGAKAQALDRASRVASEAARAGLQASPVGLIAASRGAAEAAAKQYIAAENSATKDGEVVKFVSIDVTAASVHVEVSIRGSTSFLSIVGVDHWEVSGKGEADVQYN